MADEECTSYHLTPDGWRAVDARPADALTSGEWCIGEYIYAKPYWRERWRSADADAVKALFKIHGKEANRRVRRIP